MEMGHQQHCSLISFVGKNVSSMHRRLVETQDQSGCGDEETSIFAEIYPCHLSNRQLLYSLEFFLTGVLYKNVKKFDEIYGS